MPPPPLLFTQPVLSGPGPKLNLPVKFASVKLGALAATDIAPFKDSKVIGMAPGYSKKGKLIGLAICNESKGLLIQLSMDGRQRAKSSKEAERHSDDSSDSRSGSPESTASMTTAATGDPRQLLQDSILARESHDLAIAAFDCAPLAMALHGDVDLRLTNAIDVQALFSPDKDSTANRRPTSAVRTALQSAHLGKPIKASEERLENEFLNTEFDPDKVKDRKELACRAWLACFLVSECADPGSVEDFRRIDTKNLNPSVLNMVAKLSADALKPSLSKSATVDHRISEVRNDDGVTNLTAASYKYKFRGDGKNGRIVVEGERGTYIKHTTINTAANGTGTVDSSSSPLDTTTNIITAVATTGRDDPTLAEARRADILLRVLQGDWEVFRKNPWIANIWFPGPDGTIIWPEDWAKVPPPSLSPTSPLTRRVPPKAKYNMPRLNGSQQRAVNSMLSSTDQHRFVIIQGPPGTGKTSVIGAYVIMATTMGNEGIWLVAQSNVAVKNIALKLLSIGYKDWRILVARDFHDGWHEHLYTSDSRFDGHVILSNKFKLVKPSQLTGVKVILSTISMLSNPLLSKFTKAVPIKIVVVDEASQIEIGSYVPMFHTFSSIQKVCFVGDDKQLPPHGQEEVQSLQSIFEVEHLRKHVVFLDTQYRMPPQIGEIISSAIYDSKLSSNPLHPITESVISCYFVDVSNGTEAKAGLSWKNLAEQEAVLKLASYLQEAGMQYKIITPYEGQTTAIEARMKTDGLSWEDKCFNVDAFQGNEEDYIILSLVRSRGLGFLENVRRTNVMLTRCKRGMFIITSKKFMNGIGGESLAGEILYCLEQQVGEKVWLSVGDIEKGKISNT